MFESFLYAFLLSSLNVGVAFLVILYAARKKKKDFTKIVFASMVVRYFIVSASNWIILAYFATDKLVYGLTFMITTFILILVEILYINYRAKSLNS
jgi:prolipoprotein diacylglyceryltransferase